MKAQHSALWAILVSSQVSLEVESFASGPSFPKISTGLAPSFSGPLAFAPSNPWGTRSTSQCSGTYLPNHYVNSSSASVSASALYATVGPLAQEGSWHAFLDDDDTGLVYYYNAVSGKSQWKPPSRTFPNVDLSRRMKRRMSRVQTQYMEKSKARSSSSKRKQDSTTTSTTTNPSWVETVRSFQFPEVIMPNLAAPLGTPTSSSSGGPSLNFPALNLPWQTAAVEQTSLFEEEGTSTSTFLDSLTLPKLPELPVRVLDNFQFPWETTPTPAAAVEEYTFKTEHVDTSTVDRKVEAAGPVVSLMERMETTKAAMVGFVSGGAAAPLTALHNQILPETAVHPWGYDLIESAMFAIVYRYCIRETTEENEKLQDSIRQDFVGAFVLVRTLSQLRMSSLCATTGGGDCGPFHFDFNMFQQGLVGGLESAVMFGFAATAMDFCIKQGLISKLK